MEEGAAAGDVCVGGVTMGAGAQRNLTYPKTEPFITNFAHIIQET
jgi:hypothetical protein